MADMKKKNTFADLKNDEKKARRDIIIEAAIRVFAVKPFNKVSIRDIAREAGISHASIYWYFPDQQSLFLEAFLQGAGEVMSILDEIIKNSKKETIEKVAKAYLSYLIDNDQYSCMMAQFYMDGSLSAAMLDKLHAYERLFFDKIDIIFRKMNMPEPVRPLSHAFIAALNGVLLTFKNSPGRNVKAVHQHMHYIAQIIVAKFYETVV
jgi:AcrR family transcriptional regulator